jgi:flagellar biosynthesis protein
MNKKRQDKVAVALKYNPTDRAPRVIAKGKNYIADKIVKIGKEENIYIHKEDELARSLYNLEIGTEIPEEYYTVVAEILAFVFYLDKKQGENTYE